jgi:pilus assembly protein CpaC
MRTTARAVRSILILLILVGSPRVLFADVLAPIKLMVGRSAVIDVGTAIARVSLTSSDVADAMVTSGNQLLVNGKMPGTISMFVWERSGALRQYEIIVQRDLARLNEQILKLFPGEAVEAQSNGKAVVLSGFVSSKDIMAKASSVASGYVERPEDVVNLLQLRDTGASNQVLLRVRFAEVSRSAITDLGAAFFTGVNGYKDVVGRATTNQTPAPSFVDDKLVFSDFLNLFLFDATHNLGTVIKALQTKGLFQSLAEPNLVAESGKEASFLAGGEFPVPVAQGSGGNVAISVQYKEFGVRLNFTPVIVGNRVHLKVRPEVSTLDFANAVVLQGFRIPALSTRRTETELELEDGQTFAIAGLINNQMNSTMQKIPGIGDIPILGLLFRSKAAQKDKTELVVMITPQILPRNSSGVTPALPRLAEPFMAPLPEKRTHEAPPPAFSTPVRGAAVAAPKVTLAPAASRQDDGSAASAAATVGALMRPKPMPLVVQGPPPMPSPVVESPASTPLAATPLAATQIPVAVAAPVMTPEPPKADAGKLKKASVRDAKLAHEQAGRDFRAGREQAKKDAIVAREQARKDAIASQLQAKRDGDNARVAAEESKRQAELQKKRQKALDEAAALAKAAEDRYQAELAKKQQK